MTECIYIIMLISTAVIKAKSYKLHIHCDFTLQTGTTKDTNQMVGLNSTVRIFIRPTSGGLTRHAMFRPDRFVRQTTGTFQLQCQTNLFLDTNVRVFDLYFRRCDSTVAA